MKKLIILIAAVAAAVARRRSVTNMRKLIAVATLIVSLALLVASPAQSVTLPPEVWAALTNEERDDWSKKVPEWPRLVPSPDDDDPDEPVDDPERDDWSKKSPPEEFRVWFALHYGHLMDLLPLDWFNPPLQAQPETTDAPAAEPESAPMAGAEGCEPWCDDPWA